MIKSWPTTVFPLRDGQRTDYGRTDVSNQRI